MSKVRARVRSGMLHGLSLAMMILPSSLKVLIYRHVYGFKIGKNVKIGLSWISVAYMEIEDHVTIRHFNRFKGVPVVRIGNHSVIGVGNTFTSTYEFTNPAGIRSRGNQPMLIVGEHCGITMFHYFDIQDTVEIGPFTTLAGRGSVFFTHYLDVITGSQSTNPIRIGQYCMIGSNVCFAPGASVPDYCVVGMGAVVTNQFTESYKLIAGNPARTIRELPHDAAYFHRERGWISSYVGAPEDRS